MNLLWFLLLYNIFIGMCYILKSRTKISLAIDTKLYNKLKELSEKTRIPISKLLDETLFDLLEKHKSWYFVMDSSPKLKTIGDFSYPILNRILDSLNLLQI